MNSSAPPSLPAETEPSVEAAVPSGAPYRVAELALPNSAALPLPRRPRPVLGPAVGLFAVVLWAFVVVGQFATSWSVGAPLGQGPALLIVLAATLTAWVGALRRSHAAAPPTTGARFVLRAGGIAVLGLAFFLATIFAATAASQLSWRNHDLAIAFALVVTAIGAAVVAPRLTSTVRPEQTHRTRVVLVLLWIAGAIVTVVAGADLLSNG